MGVVRLTSCSSRSRLRICEKAEVGPILNRIKVMKIDLTGRWSPSSDDVPLASATVQTEHSKTRADIHARLECCLLHMFIGRPFILTHRQVVLGENTPESSTVSRVGPAEPHGQWSFLIQDCVAAAKEVIRLCDSLQTEGMGLAKSSYIEYSSCRASLLVLIAYSICYRTNEFASTLQRGLNAIRAMASVGDSARSEVSLLETLEAALHRLHVFDPLPGQPTEPPEAFPVENGYASLLSWYTSISGPANSGVDSTCNSDKRRAAKTLQPRETISHEETEPVGDDPGEISIDTDASFDIYPFDFDLWTTDAGTSLFTPDFNEPGNPERELFENLLWIPK